MHKKGLNKVDTGAFAQQPARCFQESLDEFTCSALHVWFHDLNFCVVGLDDESWQQKHVKHSVCAGTQTLSLGGKAHGWKHACSYSLFSSRSFPEFSNFQS